MTNSNNNHSPRQRSPLTQPPTSAFTWPIPSPPPNKQEISVKEILETYKDDPDLLKHVLLAKAEEDKKQAAGDTLKAEQARIYLKQMDLELMREQAKARYQQDKPSYAGHYGLAPVQQQVLARITGSDPYHHHHHGPSSAYVEAYPAPHHHRPPPSPVAYPHSAHPLCPPEQQQPPYRPATRAQHHHRLQPPAAQPSTPVSPTAETRKRGRASLGDEQDRISHNKVMEALKAKIQRGSPLTATPPSFRPPEIQTEKNKRARSLPKPPSQSEDPSASPSPRSAKPILPPIDTSVGRIRSPPPSSSANPVSSLRTYPSTSPANHALANERRSTPSPPLSDTADVPKESSAQMVMEA
ncbi:hypothetical protein DFQ28_007135 [Apophysomyces sp. BC1034]|nr:hypothetical protein DFQ30_007062 [Apophysomyces sp. BC1015]KAG0176581.1 hypothetical protein DFQ29_005947 [Apophysomyces sp. BC1021]KAG0186923.1 hypothetical protein DFQ28_007135 [Apophysomyces sp. BC1034]